MLSKFFNLFRRKRPTVNEVWKPRDNDTESYATILSVVGQVVYFRHFGSYTLTYKQMNIKDFMKEYKFAYPASYLDNV